MKNIESLRRQEDFKRVYHDGKSFANKYLVMYVLENNIGKNRLGISVSKKVGNSVVRHRITRLIRESYRLHISNSSLDLSNSSFDIVVIARNAAAGIRFAAAESAFCHLLKLHKIVF